MFDFTAAGPSGPYFANCSPHLKGVLHFAWATVVVLRFFHCEFMACHRLNRFGHLLRGINCPNSVFPPHLQWVVPAPLWIKRTRCCTLFDLWQYSACHDAHRLVNAASACLCRPLSGWRHRAPQVLLALRQLLQSVVQSPRRWCERCDFRGNARSIRFIASLNRWNSASPRPDWRNWTSSPHLIQWRCCIKSYLAAWRRLAALK